MKHLLVSDWLKLGVSKCTDMNVSKVRLIALLKVQIEKEELAKKECDVKIAMFQDRIKQLRETGKKQKYRSENKVFGTPTQQKS